jgi:hypothetical protein
MAGKSYKDYLDESKEKEKAPVAEKKNSKDIEEVEEEIVVERPATSPQPTMTVMDNTAITETLEEQREESRKVLESIAESNATLVETMQGIVESNSESNKALLEALTALTDKIELLETKLEAIENLEIPTPIVNLSMPAKRVEKKVHRDKKGVITHITESEVFDEEDDGDE